MIQRSRSIPCSALALLAAAFIPACSIVSGWGDLQGGSRCDGPCDLQGGDAQVGDAAVGDAHPSSIAFVQAASSSGATSGSTATAAFSTAQLATSTNVVAIGCNEVATIASITDTSGNAYALAVGPTQEAGGLLTQWIYYAKNIKVSTAGTNTVTVVFTSSVAGFDLRAAEYAGLDPSAPLDKTAGASGTGIDANSGSVTTTSGSELIFGAGMTTDAFAGPGAMFTARALTSQGDLLEDQLVHGAGAYVVTAPLQHASAHWVIQLATFR